MSRGDSPPVPAGGTPNETWSTKGGWTQVQKKSNALARAFAHGWKENLAKPVATPSIPPAWRCTVCNKDVPLSNVEVSFFLSGYFPCHCLCSDMIYSVLHSQNNLLQACPVCQAEYDT